MIDPVLLLAFIPAALALNLVPGADMMFCLGQGLRGGARASWAASAGITVGSMVHILIAGLGLGAMLAAYPLVFGAIRVLGALYLLYLAWKTWTTPIVHDLPRGNPDARAFRDGMLVNLSNPKVILFILAFLPQFIDPARPVLPQFLIYGGVIGGGGLVINGLVGTFAARVRGLLLRRPGAEKGLRGVVAAVFTGLAAKIGWEALRA